MSEDARARVRRRLAAILVAGYSRLFPGDEKEDFAELRAFGSKLIEPLILEFGGNTFKETAELVLAEFESAVEATRSARYGGRNEPDAAGRTAHRDADRDQFRRRHSPG